MDQLDVRAIGGYYNPSADEGGHKKFKRCVLTASISQITIDETYGNLNAVSVIHA